MVVVLFLDDVQSGRPFPVVPHVIRRAIGDRGYRDRTHSGRQLHVRSTLVAVFVVLIVAVRTYIGNRIILTILHVIDT